jgi:tetratricopeptide (TPR) repeat protein
MKKLTWIFAALAVATGAQARSQDQQRVDAIWDAADNRMSQQIDVLFNDGDFPAVVSLLSVQLELHPADYEVATNLGWMQENIQDWDEALATYVRFEKLNPNDPDRMLPEADFYFRQKAYAKIPALLEPAIRQVKHPHPNVYRLLAHAYEREKLYGDAKRVYLAYLAVAPNDMAAKANLAKVEKQLAANS